MDLDWIREAVSFKAGASHFFWEFVVIGGLGMILKKFRDSYGRQDEAWKKRKSAWLYTVIAHGLAIAVISFVAAQFVYSLLPAPHFTPELLGGIGLADSGPSNHPITATLRIYNSGSPSVISDWNLMVKSSDKKEMLRASILDATKSYSVHLTDRGGKTLTFTNTESIAFKTAYDPMGTGAMSEGHIVFAVGDAQRAFLDAPGTVFELSFRDVKYRKYTVRYVQPKPKRL